MYYIVYEGLKIDSSNVQCTLYTVHCTVYSVITKFDS